MAKPAPLPTILITGYLGSGKTTFINRLLSTAVDQRITVLVNDFGEIAIDERLIANRDGDTLALTNGCMCCSIGGALFDAIDKILRADPRPDYLLIETSGVADPGKIAQIAVAEPDMSYAGCLVMVDAVNFELQLKDRLISDTLTRQLKHSQVVGITKSDLFDQNDFETVLASVGAHAASLPTITVSNGNLPFEFLLEKFSEQTTSTIVKQESIGHENHGHHHDLYKTWSFCGELSCGVDHLRAITEPSKSGIYRLKGFLNTDGEEMILVHRAGNDFQTRSIALDDKRTQLVAIGSSETFSPDKFEREWQKFANPF